VADYWIKLYHELLDDPKMALLPDRLWRRTIELFLLAGKVNKNGLLPDTAEVAWMLRCNRDEIQLDMDQIAMAGIIYKVDEGWMVAKFEERQAASTSTERSRYFRQNQKKEIYYGDKSRTTGIYKITCTKNNKVYIGSSVDCDKRIKTHFYEGKTFSDHWMYEDLKVYGRKAFKSEILEELEFESELQDRETFWIDQYKSSGLYNTELIGKPHRDRKATQAQRFVAQITDTDTEADTEADTDRDSARASEQHPKADDFDILQAEIESVIGLPQGSDAVKTIQELITIGAEACDIQEAADWYRSNGKTIRSASALIGPVRTAVMKRKQQARAPAREKNVSEQKSAAERFIEQETEKYNASIRY